MFNLHKKNTRGFTLIELLLVISIIGLLSSIVLGALNDAKKKAEVVAAVQHLKQLNIAMELYKLDHGGSHIKLTPNGGNDWIVGEDVVTALTGMDKLAPKYIPIIKLPPGYTTQSYDEDGYLVKDFHGISIKYWDSTKQSSLWTTYLSCGDTKQSLSYAFVLSASDTDTYKSTLESMLPNVYSAGHLPNNVPPTLTWTKDNFNYCLGG